MLRKDPFRGPEGSLLVDKVLKSSYEVVKDVYWALPLLKRIDDSPVLPVIVNNMDIIRNVAVYQASLEWIDDNLEFVQNLPDTLEAFNGDIEAAKNTLDEARKEQEKKFAESVHQLIVETTANLVQEVRAEIANELDALKQEYIVDFQEIKAEVLAEFTNKQTIFDNSVTQARHDMEILEQQAKNELVKAATDAVEEANTKVAESLNQIAEAEEHALANILEAEKHVKDELEDSITQITEIKEQAQQEFDDAVKVAVNDLSDKAEKATEAVKEATENLKKSSFSFRQALRLVNYGEAVAGDTLDLIQISPNTCIKVGDHIVDPDGNVFEVTAYDEAQGKVTVGQRIACIKGARGEDGDSFKLNGVVDNEEGLPEFGTQGDMYYDESTGNTWVWDTATGSWKEAGQIRGPAGKSANEILMSPDPWEYFKYIYGLDTQTEMGDVFVDVDNAALVPDPLDTFNTALVD